MPKVTAPMLGAISGAMLMTAYVIWDRTRPPPCTGAVFIELRPPLAEPGPYRFHLALDEGEKACEFDVPLPLHTKVNTAKCAMPLALETRVHGGSSSIVGLTVGAAAELLELKVTRNAELIYDAHLEPKYAPYATRREDSKRFCGERAFVQPACVRGSTQCTPYRAACDGPEDCPEPKVCCASPEWGHEYGVRTATECVGRGACLARLAHIACHEDAHCPSDMACNDASLARDFDPPLRACKSTPSR